LGENYGQDFPRRTMHRCNQLELHTGGLQVATRLAVAFAARRGRSSNRKAKEFSQPLGSRLAELGFGFLCFFLFSFFFCSSAGRWLNVGRCTRCTRCTFQMCERAGAHSFPSIHIRIHQQKPKGAAIGALGTTPSPCPCPQTPSSRFLHSLALTPIDHKHREPPYTKKKLIRCEDL